jgi:mRNA-degrading endonuclease RelE of RelBE toxin-antitoxin system
MTYDVRLQGNALDEVRRLRPFDQRRIADEMRNQLVHEPAVVSKNRKCLLGLTPGFDFVPPLWELRVGEFRVFYDIDEEAQVVNVRAVRRKATDQTTEDVV